MASWFQGNATCSSEQRGAAEKFVIQYHPDGSGRWAIRNRTTGYYFGGTEDMIQCYEKQAGPSEWWFVHLAIHPQVCMYTCRMAAGLFTCKYRETPRIVFSSLFHECNSAQDH